MNNESIFQVGGELPAIQPEILFFIHGWPVSNSTVTGFVLTTLLFFLGLYVWRNTTSPPKTPSAFMLILEMIYEGVISFIDRVTGDATISKRLLPFIGSILIFFTLANTITLIPPFSFLTFNGISLFRTHTDDFNTTLAVATLTILFGQYLSIAHIGLINHISKYIQIKAVITTLFTNPKKIMEAVILFFIGLLDIFSEISRIFSLSLRLFGNMFAADLLLVIFFSLFAVGIPGVWILMGMLTGVIQAIVFGALSATYISLALKQSH